MKGKSLQTLFEEQGKRFSTLCVYFLAEKIVNFLRQQTVYLYIADCDVTAVAFEKDNPWKPETIQISRRFRASELREFIPQCI